MKVKSITECSTWSILQYFWPALSDKWSWNQFLVFMRVAVLHRFYCISTSDFHSKQSSGANSLVIWIHQKPADLDLHCFEESKEFWKLGWIQGLLSSAKLLERRTLANSVMNYISTSDFHSKQSSGANLLVILIYCLDEDQQCRSWSAGFIRSQLIWIYTVLKRVQNYENKVEYKIYSYLPNS